MQSQLTGDYLSAFKGTGLDFDQLRDYEMGDDVRFIDWNSSAKANKLVVKQFIEERDRTIILAIDVSASTNFSSTEELRNETIAHLATALTFIANINKDKVGVLFFSDHVEKWIPPSRGKAHYNTILKALFTIKVQNKKTSINQALHFLLSLKKRNAILFMLSDWIDDFEGYSKLLKIARFKYDFIGVRLLDEREEKLPAFGLLPIYDPETGETITIDTRPKKKKINEFLQNYRHEQKKNFEKHKIELLDLEVGKPFINPLIKFFHKRTRRQI